MPSITLNHLKDVLGKAYIHGYHNCLDMKDSFVDDLVKILFEEPKVFSKNDGWKVFTVKELRQLSVGTIFEHSVRGKCYIEAGRYSSAKTFMHFEDGSRSEFVSDCEPWNQVMKIIGSQKKRQR